MMDMLGIMPQQPPAIYLSVEKSTGDMGIDINRFIQENYSNGISFESNDYADQICLIKEVFDGCINQLPMVFGVSRQTIYNWFKGEEPSNKHLRKISELYQAANVFKKKQFQPTPNAMRRPIAKDSKTFPKLLSEGLSGVEYANLLIELETKGKAARERLKNTLKNRPYIAESENLSLYGLQVALDEGA